jgi:hypothetical protein
MQRLSMDEAILRHARQDLISAELIAWQKPLCQVLALDNFSHEDQPATRRSPLDKPHSIGQIFQKIMEGSS